MPIASPPVSRRAFAGALGAGVGATLFRSRPSWAALPPDAPPDAIQLNANENPDGPAPAALEAIARLGAEAARYPDASHHALVEAVARHHGVEPDGVVLGCGSSEVLRLAAMAFLAPDRTLVVAEPTFEAVLGYARVPAAHAVKLPLSDDFRHDLPRIARACDDRTGLAYVCNPNNPTGTLVSGRELRAFVEAVPQATTILVDEAYHHYVEDVSYASATELLPRAPNVVVVRTFSKIFGLAGLRLGYAVAHPERIEAMRRHLVWDSANAAALAAARACLGDEAHVAAARRSNAETRRLLVAALEGEGRRVMPSHTNFVMIHLGRDVEPVVAAFRERKILVGRPFPALPEWLRVSVGAPPAMEAFLAALREIVPASAAAA